VLRVKEVECPPSLFTFHFSLVEGGTVNRKTFRVLRITVSVFSIFLLIIDDSKIVELLTTVTSSKKNLTMLI
jgi:hypothetical protein